MTLGILKDQIVQRCGGRCEYPLCRKRTWLDSHHVVKRSHAAAEAVDCLDGLVAICRDHHEMTDRIAPDNQKELLILPLGNEVFDFYQWIYDEKAGRVVHHYERPLPLDGPQRPFKSREVLEADRLNAALRHGLIP